LEARGFESVWAPEHSHIRSTRKTPPASGGELEKRYYDVMDPFVTLTAAAMRTRPKPDPPVTVGGAFPHSARRAVRYGGIVGPVRVWYPPVVVSLPSAPSVEVLPTLDRWAEIIRKSAN
jgi:hypothetical protein